MAESSRQKRIAGRVMHEFKHGELKSGGGEKVKSRRQAVAIALSEAGANARTSTARGRKAAAAGATRDQLYARAQKKGVAGRSRMSKQQLETALGLT